MTSNLPFSPEFQGGQGNNPASQRHVTFKLRAVRVLRACINAPGGLGIEAVYRALPTLEPVPTYREAAQLTEKLPTQVGSRVLSRYFALLQAVKRIEAQRMDVQAKNAHKPAQALVTPVRTYVTDWTPTQEGGAA